MPISSASIPPLLDSRQLVRVEAVHRGFLFQHLYALACLFGASKAGASGIIVERDEDIEIVLPQKRIYVQVKTRAEPLVLSDIQSALDRFDALRAEHASGRRAGAAAFFIAANRNPGPVLTQRIADESWPKDVAFDWPDSGLDRQAPLPKPWNNVQDALVACCDTAATLPFAMLSPETLVWKLAGHVMAAAAGIDPHVDHTFRSAELPALFEQLVIQLQDFPAPPIHYRPQDAEPALIADDRVRLITGFSGAGKTSWVSQAALHATDVLAYFNVSEVPGSALATAVARELAARLFGKPGGGLGEVLLPGATGPEILFAIGRHLAETGKAATLVIDNAHMVAPTDLRALIELSPHLRFILLAQPGPNVALIEATLGIAAEPLRGWTNETIAAEGSERGCHGDYQAYERLLGLTAGLPLYVQNALQISAQAYQGSVSRFGNALEAQTHTVATAQELILAQVFDTYNSHEK